MEVRPFYADFLWAMLAVVFTPFFLLFCATSALAAFLAHRLVLRDRRPTLADRLLAVVAALLSLGLSIMCHQMHAGVYRPAYVNPDVAWIAAAITGLGVAFVCIHCVLPDRGAE